jgi:hypothetical protein
MNRQIVMLSVVVASVLGSIGCAGSQAAQPAAPVQWEKRVLAPGVELHVATDAGVGASQAADDVAREFRARHLPAQ